MELFFQFLNYVLHIFYRFEGLFLFFFPELLGNFAAI